MDVAFSDPFPFFVVGAVLFGVIMVVLAVLVTRKRVEASPRSKISGSMVLAAILLLAGGIVGETLNRHFAAYDAGQQLQTAALNRYGVELSAGAAADLVNVRDYRGRDRLIDLTPEPGDVVRGDNVPAVLDGDETLVRLAFDGEQWILTEMTVGFDELPVIG